MGTQHQAVWPGWTAHKTLELPIPPAQWRPPVEPIEIDGVMFQPKRELHVTLIPRGLGQALHSRPERPRAVRQAFARQDWHFTRTGQWLQLEKHELPGGGRGRAIGSIIERIEMPALVPFYDELAELLGHQLALPPAHVTLYTAGRSQGIGVPDIATLRRLTVRQVPAPGERSRDGSPPHHRRH